VGVLLAIGAVVLAYETRGTTFWADEWNWILTRRGGAIATYLDPHNSHLSLVPVVIYKLLFATVGLRHYWPYRTVLIAVDLGCALLAFLYARARVGDWLALVATALILFFGPGWQDILWPFQIGFLAAVGAGVAALLLLDRRDRAGEIGACVALLVSVASSAVGLAMWLGALVDVAQRRRWRELWIVAIPIVLYAAWWLGYEQSHIFAHAFVLVPKFVLHAVAGALSSLAGLATIDVAHDTGSYLTWGIPLLVVALAAALVVWGARGFPRLAPRVLTLLVIALGFWVLSGVGRAYVRVGPLVLTEVGSESRYLYVSALLIVLLAVELARGYRPSVIAGGVIAVLAVAATISNLSPLRAGAAFLRGQAALTRTELGTLDLSRPIVDPNFVSAGFVFNLVTPRVWFPTEHALGSVAFRPAQIAAQPAAVRAAADSQLIAIQRLALRPVADRSAARESIPTVEMVQSGAVSTRGSCLEGRPAGSGAEVTLLLAPGRGLLVRAGASGAAVAVRRFGDGFQRVGSVGASARAALTVRRDLAPQPWQVQIRSGGAFTVCGA
jgi:hypothetical protein